MERSRLATVRICAEKKEIGANRSGSAKRGLPRHHPFSFEMLSTPTPAPPAATLVDATPVHPTHTNTNSHTSSNSDIQNQEYAQLNAAVQSLVSSSSSSSSFSSTITSQESEEDEERDPDSDLFLNYDPLSLSHTQFHRWYPRFRSHSPPARIL